MKNPATHGNPATSAAPAIAASERARAVDVLAREQGFALVGVAPAEASAYVTLVRDWIAAGRQGEMHYLANNLETRLDPRRLLSGARSIICVADFYVHEGTEGQRREAAEGAEGGSGGSGGSGGGRGRFARYGWGDDYHKVMKKRLHALADALRQRWPEAVCKCTVDTAPILEREHAARAGLGWVGKHTLLIHPRLGSYMLLGAIVTTLEIEPTRRVRCADLPESDTAAYTASPGADGAGAGAEASRSAQRTLRTLPPLPGADHCGTCTRCIDACPTQCIENPAETGRRSVDATRCISYLTLEHRGPIEASLHEAMGDWVAGCDVCQEVCPFNVRHEGTEGKVERRNVPDVMHPRYAPRPALVAGVPLIEMLGWTEEDRRAAFQSSAFKRIKLDMLKRNALIAAGNALREREDAALREREDAALRERVAALAADEGEAELVRETARQVLAGL